MALILSAAKKYYKECGHYPKKIRELSPKFVSENILIDPFSDGDLKYKWTLGEGFALCSKGMKGKCKDKYGRYFCINQAR
jgi:hypothetical protein